MDIKDLNKPQLILLALLLSFVTSIATGIITVTLMQQAPPSVTVPINRVVRETVEKIVPVPGKNTVQTVVVKEEDLVVDAIAKNKGAIFSVTKELISPDGKSSEIEAGFGFAVSEEGIIVIDASLASREGAYLVQNDKGKFKTDIVPFSSPSPADFLLLKINVPSDKDIQTIFTVPEFGDIDNMRPGQKILVSGASINSFIVGGTKSDGSLSSGLHVNMSNISRENTGALISNLDGEALGIFLPEGAFYFADMKAIMNALESRKPSRTPILDFFS